MNRRQLIRLAALAGAPGIGSLGLLTQTAKAQSIQAGTDTRTVRFALLGDTPYDAGEEADFADVLTAATQDSAFLIHVGDIKSGIESCADELLSARLAMLYATNHPTVFVPGDNEWTDCHRVPAGLYDPIERLARLRKIAFETPAWVQPPGLEQQNDTHGRWPEHQRWRQGPALFVSLNVSGSANGLKTRIDQLSHRQRATAASAWLLDSARDAARFELPFLVISIHAATELSRLHERDVNADVSDRNNPFGWFRALLWQVVASFPGQVVLLNGDQHVMRHERPWVYGQFARVAAERFQVSLADVQDRMARFRRIQTFGSPWSRHYLLITLSVTPQPQVIVDVRSV